MTNSASIDKSTVQVLNSPFSYIKINSFNLDVIRHSDDPDDLSMNLSFDILTGEWLPEENNNLVLVINTQSIPKDLLLSHEKTLSPTCSFLNLLKRHRFHSVNNQHVVISQPFKNSSNSVTLTIKNISPHKYSLTRITSPPITDVDYNDDQIDVKLLTNSRELSSKYLTSNKPTSSIIKTSGSIGLEIALDRHEARKRINLDDLTMSLRVLGGCSSSIGFSINLDRLPAFVTSKETTSKLVKVHVQKMDLWDDEILEEKIITARLTLYKNSDQLILDHVDNDVKKLEYLSPGHDYIISTSEDIEINYY